MNQYVVYDEVADFSEDPYIGPDIAAVILNVAVDSGLLTEWATVEQYRRNDRVVLCRKDTDGQPLVVPVRAVRQALRRIRRLEMTRTGLFPAERRAILETEEHGTPLPPEHCDLVVQIAAIGRVVYR